MPYGDTYLDSQTCDRVDCTNRWDFIAWVDSHEPDPDNPDIQQNFMVYICESCFDDEPFAEKFSEDGYCTVYGGAARV